MRVALGLEVAALATPIAASFGWIAYDAVHPKSCSGPCGGQASTLVFLLCVAVLMQQSPSSSSP